MVAVETEMLQRAREWVKIDPNPVTVDYVNSLLDSNDPALSELFPSSRIAFGTAGLRAAMKPGPVGMNDLVVLQTAQGIARYCQSVEKSQGTPIRAVVGYDHRQNSTYSISSLGFAIMTALVFRQAGLDCLLLDGYVATPLVPFSLSNIGATVGVMITASHNPKLDAGYKIYWKNGCQIRPPIDSGMAKSIDDNLEPWADYGKLLAERKAAAKDSCLGLSDPEKTKEIIKDYFDAVKASGLVSGQSQHMDGSWEVPKFCYTAMHGVGLEFAKKSFSNFGLPSFESVKEQETPDPEFPTVPFPNPEETGALDMAQAVAQQSGCKIILANDPDADRLAVAEYDGSKWNVFTGDQIGVLLGHWMWTIHKDNTSKPLAMCASTVSSTMLAQIAKVEGFHFQDTLTGFKWIGSTAAELQASGKYNVIFGYEEAIGFCCGNVVFDKDGVTAMAVMAELALSCYRNKSTLAKRMQSLYDKYGEFVSRNGYYKLRDVTIVPDLMNQITNGGKFDNLDSIGSYKVDSFRYLGEPGFDSSTCDSKPTLPCSASSPMLTLRFSNGLVLSLRASGTEPKFKYYSELQGKPGVPRAQVENDINEMVPVILETLLQPEKYGMRLP